MIDSSGRGAQKDRVMVKKYTPEEEEEIWETEMFDSFQGWTDQTSKYPKVYLVVDEGGDMIVEGVEQGKSLINMTLQGKDFRIVDGSWLYPVLGLVGEAGELADKFKKVVRDDGGILTAEKKKGIQLELGDVQFYVARVAKSLETNLSDVVRMLRAKLLDRKARGKIGGSGDAR